MSLPMVFKSLFASEKAVFVGLLVIAASALTALDLMSVAEWQDYTKWLAGIYVGGKSIQGAAEAFARRPITPPAPAASSSTIAVLQEPSASP